MILISHRGNTNGPNPLKENHPHYVEKTINMGYEVEIDVRLINNKIYLGHDDQQHEIDLDWLLNWKDKLWVHCKNIQAIEYFHHTGLNYFWHDIDTMTLTSKGYIWAHPGKQPIKYSIAVMPELKYKLTGIEEDLSICSGVCSDFIQNYKI